MFEAIEAIGSSNPAGIGDWLKASVLDTPLGPVTFDENGEVVGDEVRFMVYEISGGQFVEATP